MSANAKRRIAQCATAAVASFVVAACASIMHGTHEDVGISSTPSSAQVTIDGQMTGKTPVVAHLTRKENHIVRIELPGYQPYEGTITHSVSGWVWGNIAFGGLIGLAVDAIDGGMYKLEPEQLSGVLQANNAVVTPNRDGIYMVVVLAPEPGWQKIAQLQRQ